MKTPKPTLRVQGHGNIATAPDVVVLSLAIASEDRDYGKSIEDLNKHLEALRRAVAKAGEDPKALKTTSFDISIATDYVRDKRVFRGFAGDHRLQLRLPFDQARLGRLFVAVSACPAKPQLTLAFTVSDPEAVRQRVLEEAVKNARQRAAVIAAAAGQRLGAIVGMDYGYTEVRVSSDPFLLREPSVMESAPEIEPSDIDSADTVQIVWEIIPDATSVA